MAFSKPIGMYDELPGANKRAAILTAPEHNSHSGPAVTLSMLTSQMIVAQATVHVPQVTDPNGKPVRPGEMKGLASANANVLYIDIPDPRHPATAQAVHAALEQAKVQHASLKPPEMHIPHEAPKLHFVAPFLKNNEAMINAASGFSYDPVTGHVTEVFANTRGAEARALAEANRLHLHTEGAAVKPFGDDHKAIFRTQHFMDAADKLHETVEAHQQTNPQQPHQAASTFEGLKMNASTAPPAHVVATTQPPTPRKFPFKPR